MSGATLLRLVRPPATAPASPNASKAAKCMLTHTRANRYTNKPSRSCLTELFAAIQQSFLWSFWNEKFRAFVFCTEVVC